MKRRRFLCSALALMPLPARAAVAVGNPYPAAELGRPLEFPRDFGSHPAFRTEWWYITGWLQRADGPPFGVQVTFFRHRPHIGEDSSSRFAPTQLLFAHAAVADPRWGRLRFDQRAARAGFGLAQAAEGATDVRIADWSLRREANAYVTRIEAREFALALTFATTQLPILQGERGYSRKGADPRQASYYYSEPQLAVTGIVTIEGREASVTGTAWCDHEWSSEVLAGDAAGWDWTGINLADGGALMAF
ncbi:MAG: lipocalin-like domain-containing protein, partial [Betaproteobacteria bacterium]